MENWTGNSNSIYKTLGASNHTKDSREQHDYYATDPKAAEFLIGLEHFENVLEPSCVDKDTEYFNGYGWKKISEYNGADKVLQFNKDTTANLVHPLKYIKTKAEYLYLFTHKNLNMSLCKNHNVVFFNNKNELCKKPFREILKTYLSDSNGFRGKIPLTFKKDGDLTLNEWELRLAIACNADGRTRTKHKNTYEIRVKKKRKRNRLIWILDNLKQDYAMTESKEYYNFKFQSPLGCKKFPKQWYNLSLTSKKVIIDEIFHWDGNITKDYTRHYFSSKKEDIDLIQFIFHSSGFSSNLYEDKRKGRNTSYRLTLKTNNKSALRKSKNAMEIINTPDGYKYCFSVDSGMLVLRRKGKIFITGNCGEGHLSKVFSDAGINVTSSDLINRGYGTEKDFFDYKEWNGDIVTNPPYKHAQKFIEHALNIIPEGRKVAMFLKLQFLEGKKRKNLFIKNPPKKLYVSSSRLLCAKNADFEGMRKGGGSAVAYGWFVWEKGFKGKTEIEWFN